MTRACNSPEPQYGGTVCSGDESYFIPCSGKDLYYISICQLNDNIIVDGLWSDWAETTACDQQTGLINRTRACDSPTPKNGGSMCPGLSEDQILCPG